MSKLIKCKTCGADIAKSAKVCPYCGAKNRNRHPILGTIILIIGIVLILSALFGNDDSSPRKVDEPVTKNETQASTNNQQEEKKMEKETFGVGEAVNLNDIIVTLVDVAESSGANYMNPGEGNVFVLCEFNIENNSSKDIAVSSIMSFEAYIDDYSTGMSLSAIVSSGKTQPDGTIASGKKMNGVMGYEVEEGWSSLEIRFTPDFWSGKDITFVYAK